MGKKSVSQSQQSSKDAVLLQNQNPSSASNSRILRFDSILKKGEDDKGNIYYKIKWKDLPKEDASFEPIENLSAIKNEMKEYDTNYFLSIKEIEVNPIKVNFIKKFQGQFYCNVLFEKIEKKERNENNKPFIANLYIKYNNLRKIYPKLLINYFEQFYRD